MDGPGWRVGSRFGPYELRALLGKGGMGEVYEAYDTVKERVVAVKLLPEELAKDPVYQVRFRRESQAAARLAEPHIIPIHDWGVIDGVLFIDMRLVPGADLRTLLRGQGPLQPERAIAIIEQIAAALDAAHADGLVHRDVKPANILVTEADFAYLADFGIAHTEGDAAVTQVGMAVGSYVYMAPERFDAGQVTGRADIYSLACVLHESLTGATPFPQASMSVLIRSHLTETPPRPSVARPGVPPALDEVIARGMAKDPADRYPTAAAFAQAARAAVGAPAAPAPRFVVHAPDPSRFAKGEAARNVVVPPEATGEFSVVQPQAATEVSLVDFQFTPFLPAQPVEPEAATGVPVRPFPDAHLYGETEQYPSGQFAAVPAADPITQKYTAPYGSEPQPYTPPDGYTEPHTPRFADPSEGFPDAENDAQPSAFGESQRYPEPSRGFTPPDSPAFHGPPSRGFDDPEDPESADTPDFDEPAPHTGSQYFAQPRGFEGHRSSPDSEDRFQGATPGRPRGFGDLPGADEPQSSPQSRGFDAPHTAADAQASSKPRGFEGRPGYDESLEYGRSAAGAAGRGFEAAQTYSASAGYEQPETGGRPRDVGERPGYGEPRGYDEPRSYSPGMGREERDLPGDPVDYSQTRGFGDPPGYDKFQPGEHPAPGFEATQAYSASKGYAEPRGFGEPQESRDFGGRPRDDAAYSQPRGFGDREYSEGRGFEDPESRNEPAGQAYSEYATQRGSAAEPELTAAARAYPVDPYGEQAEDHYAAETRHYPQYGGEPAAQAYSEDPYRPEAQAYSEYQPSAPGYGPDYDDDRYSPRGGYGRGEDGPDYGPEYDDDYQQPSSNRSIVMPILIGVLSVVVVAVAGAVGWQMFGAGNSQPVADVASASTSVAATPDAAAPGTPVPQSSSKAPGTTTSGTAVKLPDGAKACSTGSSTGANARAATGSEVTSCQFAEAVRKAYAESASGTRAPGSVTATSPVTGRTYTMNCVPQGQVVMCSGGENAVVYVY
ncbi:protein kinase [Nocardia sp. NPDC048505]|uniref:serine/threonine-protein kinase n=1 Tax=unclassified Nocardia TaxID=2637762 RepID=UPI003400547B